MSNLDSLSKKDLERLKKEMLEEMKKEISARQNDNKQQNSKDETMTSQINNSEAVLFPNYSVNDNDNQIILTASSNTGVGLWTSICVAFASIFGVESKNYKKKMNKVVDNIKRDLQKQMNKHKDYDFSDYRIIREKGLAYYGTVIGTKKHN